MMRALICCLCIYAVADAQAQADANCDNRVDMADVVALVQYIFGGVPLPECKPAWRVRFDAALDSAMADFTDTNFVWTIATMPPRAVSIGIERKRKK